MKLRMSDPEYVKKIKSKVDVVAMGKKVSAAILANPEECARRAERVRAKAGELQSRLVKKSWITRRERGQRAFGNRGGNGLPPTKAEEIMMKIFPEAKHNEVILSGMGCSSFESKTGYQHYYLPDLSWPDIRLAVELDGDAHLKPIQQERDRKKNFVFGKLGWILLRFSNEQVMRDANSVAAIIRSTISKLKAIQATRSAA